MMPRPTPSSRARGHSATGSVPQAGSDSPTPRPECLPKERLQHLGTTSNSRVSRAWLSWPLRCTRPWSVTRSRVRVPPCSAALRTVWLGMLAFTVARLKSARSEPAVRFS